MFHFEVVEDDNSARSRPLTAKDGPGGDSEHESFVCGDRVYDSEKFAGVIKYLGSVGKFAGTWVGVEWDIPARGKNNGCVDNQEYFKCSNSNAGSFIRPHKANKVHRLKEALDIRYSHDGAQLTSVKSIEDRLEKNKISYSHLRTLNLNSKGIEDSSHDDVAELTTLCPNIEVLELADNLISSWGFIGRLCSGFPKLTRLDLSKNPLIHDVDEISNFINSFQAVDHVILGNVGYDWDIIMKLSDVWPKLSNLQVPFNKVSSITPTATMMNVTRIDLERNKLSSWKEILKLTSVEKLEYLNLCGNALDNIRFPPEACQDSTCLPLTSYFPKLKNLNITENSIDDWISISELNKLKHLQELRVDFNPLFNKDTRATNRQLIIARLGKIQKLEGVEILRQERRDAEIDYLKKFWSQWKTEKGSFRFTAENPRYSELAEKWGESDIGETSTVAKTMKSSLISIILVVQPPSERKECTKKVLATMTIQKLKGLIQRVFREGSPPTAITAVSTRNPGVSFPLDNDFADLATYSIEEGDKLLITW